MCKKMLALLLLGYSSSVFSTNLSDYLTIFSLWLKNPGEVGECTPLSTAVCREVTRFVTVAQHKQGELGCNYLDAGAGCGAVSVMIVDKLRACDHLDLIEINPQMCAILKKRFAYCSNVSVHCCSILDWNPDYKYDAIMSTLPFNAFGVDFAQQVMALFKNISNPNCVTTYVECAIVRQLLQHFYIGKKKKNFIAVQKYFEHMRRAYLKRSKTVYLNVPPIDVYHLAL